MGRIHKRKINSTKAKDKEAMKGFTGACLRPNMETKITEFYLYCNKGFWACFNTHEEMIEHLDNMTESKKKIFTNWHYRRREVITSQIHYLYK